jgi:serine/threonine protein kinase
VAAGALGDQAYRYQPALERHVGTVELQVGTSWRALWAVARVGTTFVHGDGLDPALDAGLRLGFSTGFGLSGDGGVSVHEPFRDPTLIDVTGIGNTRYLGIDLGIGYALTDQVGLRVELGLAPYAESNAATPSLGVGSSSVADVWPRRWRGSAPSGAAPSPRARVEWPRVASKLPMPFGAYALLKSLGQGAMGDIHLARPYNVRRGIPTPIVIKRLHGELASNPDFVRRFKHEAEIAVSVDSPHVAKVYDVGAVGETLYITMEYVNGWPVSKFIEAVIASGHHANISAIVDLIAGGLRGLTALHEAKDVRTGQPLGVVHRDISPKNLMVGEDGAMRLIDLGLGKSNVQDWKTRTGVVMGSVGYMPPEQVTAEKIDHRADLYAMGAVLFELLALRHYIARGPIPIMLRRSVEPTFEPPSRFRPDVPRGLDEVLQKALELDPNQRFQSAAEFLTAIRAVVPERKSAGGMITLISELFATSLPERKGELSQLLRLPLPELEEDGPEPEHTVTFVVAEGVSPLAPEDMPRTRVTTAGEVRVGPATSRSPRAEIVPSLHQPMPMPQVYAQPEYVAPMAEGAAYTGIPPSASLPVPTGSNAVPMWVLGVAVWWRRWRSARSSRSCSRAATRSPACCRWSGPSPERQAWCQGSCPAPSA